MNTPTTTPSRSPAEPSSQSAPPPPARHPGGRRNTCTPDTLELICEGIAKGLTDTAAAALVGVPASTLSRWKHDHEGVVETFTAARERYRALLLDRLHNAKTRDGRDDWRATAWLLERSFPEDYGRKRLAQPSTQEEFHQHPSAGWNDSPDPEPERPRRDRWTPFVAERRRQEAERAAREAALATEAETTAAPSSETSETATHRVAPVSTAPEAPTSKTSETQLGASSHTCNAPEAPTSKTSETSFQPPNSASRKPAPNSSKTSETQTSPAAASPKPTPNLHEAFADSLSPQPNLSRRERRHRAHLLRKAQAAQQRAASKSAPLAAA